MNIFSRLCSHILPQTTDIEEVAISNGDKQTTEDMSTEFLLVQLEKTKDIHRFGFTNKPVPLANNKNLCVLKIVRIHEGGLLDKWNKDRRKRDLTNVFVGDEIVSVNGISGNLSEMRKPLETEEEVSLRIRLLNKHLN